MPVSKKPTIKTPGVSKTKTAAPQSKKINKQATQISKTAIGASSQRYILLPANQMQAVAGAGNADVESFLITLSQNVSQAAGLRLKTDSGNKAASSIKVNVIDSIHENGAKLEKIGEEHMADFRFSYPGLRVIPEKFYHLDYKLQPAQSSISRSGNRLPASFKSQIIVTDKTGNAIQDVYLVAFTNFAARAGASGKTDTSGKVTLTLAQSKIERIYVYPDHTCWGFFKKILHCPCLIILS